MTGERLEWFKVASHLRLTIGELKSKITYTEFHDWLVFLLREDEWHLKHEYYLARIAAEVARSRVTKPNKIKTEDFLVKIKTESEMKIERSKQAWAAACRITLPTNN